MLWHNTLKRMTKITGWSRILSNRITGLYILHIGVIDECRKCFKFIFVHVHIIETHRSMIGYRLCVWFNSWLAFCCAFLLDTPKLDCVLFSLQELWVSYAWWFLSTAVHRWIWTLTAILSTVTAKTTTSSRKIVFTESHKCWTKHIAHSRRICTTKRSTAFSSAILIRKVNHFTADHVEALHFAIRV